jgi:hypothetical protein
LRRRFVRGCCCCCLQPRFERLDASLQRGHVGGGGGAELFERARHALLEDVLQLAPLAGGLGAELAGKARHALLGLGQGFLGGLLGLLLHAGAVLDQRLEGLAAFLLHLGEGAEAGQPDLLGGVLDAVCGFGVGAVVVAVVGGGGHAGVFLEKKPTEEVESQDSSRPAPARLELSA